MERKIKSRLCTSCAQKRSKKKRPSFFVSSKSDELGKRRKGSKTWNRCNARKKDVSGRRKRKPLRMRERRDCTPRRSPQPGNGGRRPEQEWAVLTYLLPPRWPPCRPESLTVAVCGSPRSIRGLCTTGHKTLVDKLQNLPTATTNLQATTH